MLILNRTSEEYISIGFLFEPYKILLPLRLDHPVEDDLLSCSLSYALVITDEGVSKSRRGYLNGLKLNSYVISISLAYRYKQVLGQVLNLEFYLLKFSFLLPPTQTYVLTHTTKSMVLNHPLKIVSLKQLIQFLLPNFSLHFPPISSLTILPTLQTIKTTTKQSTIF
ncbi:hypothetical protein LEP1GSC106_0511 [Leptospira interrogans serovar Grippotyphosa str. UI 12764]|nr:hypothetical protein LEP1GSC106_0511 [Leptospira interrogans serovar Grippotyphosa str. UI 12764]